MSLKWQRLSPCCCVIGLALLVESGCQTKPAAPLPDKLVLYSLDGPDQAVDSGNEENRFRGARIVGSIEITQAAEISEIMTAVRKGMGRGEMAKCFYPRHGLRAIRRGHADDYVICFQCRIVAQFLHGQTSMKSESIDDSSKELLDHYLRAHNVPLAAGVR